jgi:type III secretion protein T
MIDFNPIRQFILVFGLCVIRLTAAASVTPFLSSKMIQGRVRNSIIFSLGIVVYPIVAPTLNGHLDSLLTIVVIVVKEITLGILLGFLASKLFWVATSVGYFIDNQRGSSMASVFDPSTGEQTSPLGLFFQQTLVTLFFVSGGFLVFLSALFESYKLWPIDNFTPVFNENFPTYFLGMADDLMQTAFVLAAPIVITVFVSEFGLGLMNRFAPQLNVFVLAMPVKSLVAMIVLIIYLPLLLLLFQEEFSGKDEMLAVLKGLIS